MKTEFNKYKGTIMKKLVMVIVVMFLLTIPIICAEIDGQWVGVVDGMDSKPLELYV
jgi:hypothetical protein